MDVAKALALLDLKPGANEREIRSQLFQHYQRISGELSQLDDERQRPLLEARLDRLNQARDVLLSQPAPTQPDTPLSLLSPEDLPETVMVLLYQSQGQEGIHTLRIQKQDVVIAFENMFGARKFAQRLAKQGLPKPVAERLDTSEIVEFCQGSGYNLVVIPESETFEPPEASVDGVEHWDPS